MGLLIKTIFLGLSKGLGSLASTFYFFILIAGVFIGHYVNNLAPYLVSSIGILLVIIIYLICRAQTWKCFVISRLYTDENTFSSLLKFGFESFLKRNIDKYKATQNANMYKALFLICPNLFRIEFCIALIFYRQSIL